MLSLFPNWLALPGGLAFGFTVFAMVRSYMRARALDRETVKFWGESGQS